MSVSFVFTGAFTIRRKRKLRYFSPFHSGLFLSWHPDMKGPRVVICIFTPERVFQVGIEILRVPLIPSAAVSSGLSVPLFIFNLPEPQVLPLFPLPLPLPPSLHPPALFHLSLHYEKIFTFVDLYFDLVWKCMWTLRKQGVLLPRCRLEYSLVQSDSLFLLLLLSCNSFPWMLPSRCRRRQG